MDRLKLNISFRCRSSLGLRSIHLAPNYYGRTETLTHPDVNPISPPAAGPRWVMLSSYLSRRGNFGDPKTAAESTTSTGHGFRVSAHLAAPPASSYLCYDWREGSHSSDEDDLEIIAAHGDSVLFRIQHCTMEDYFVYSAGASATSTSAPSLSLLPIDVFSESPSLRPDIFEQTTGVLRRSDDEVLVVELGVSSGSGAPRGTVDLNVLRLGSSEWDMRWAVPIVLGDGSRDGMILRRWGLPDRAVPVGTRFMCWVKYSSGFLICDMADPNLVLRPVPLPVAPRVGRGNNGRYSNDDDDDDQMRNYRNMCGAGTNGLRFVSIDPRCCCCGGPRRGSRFAFTVTTWTMNLTTDEHLTWVMDSVLDCEELWGLPGYEGLPCVTPGFPVVSPDNPNVICFKLSGRHMRECSYHVKKVWMLEVDMRKKVLLSVVQCPNDPRDHFQANFNF